MPSAKEAAVASLSAVRAKDKAAWLALFADDAVVEDPVGPSPFDPEGKGHRGKTGISAFYDNVISHNEEFDFTIHHAFECAGESASFATFKIKTRGVSFEMPIIIVHKVNADGKLTSLRAFWEFPSGGLGG
ncbi:MAG: nuclear transport factor 2 family protein [Hyphomonadaceae bacterium]|nr:nuclear transport factor 2 family protein [Hyphomonadaceae bacterium]